jgi:hypothetical protein
MIFRLVIPNKGQVEFDDYQQAIFALRPFRNNLDGIYLQELEEDGSLHAQLDNVELRKIVLEMDALSLLTVHEGY